MFFVINYWDQAGCHQAGGWTQPTGVGFGMKAESPSLPDAITWLDLLCFLMLSYKKEISLEKTVYISPLVTGSIRWIEPDLNPVSGSIFLTHTMYHVGTPHRRQTLTQLTSASTAHVHRSFRKCRAGYFYNTPFVWGKNTALKVHMSKFSLWNWWMLTASLRKVFCSVKGYITYLLHWSRKCEFNSGEWVQLSLSECDGV